MKNRMKAIQLVLSAYEWEGVRLIWQIIVEMKSTSIIRNPQQATNYGLVWTWWVCTEESQDDSLHGQVYGDCVLGLEGDFTPWIPSCPGARWSTLAHRVKTWGATAVSYRFLEYLSIIYAKRNFKSSSTFIWRKFFWKRSFWTVKTSAKEAFF